MYCIYRVTNNVNGRTYIGQHKYVDENDPMGRYKGKHSRKRSEEQKRRISEAHIGQRVWNKNKKIGHWYNNGVKSVMTLECPEGFVPGRLPMRKNNKPSWSKGSHWELINGKRVYSKEIENANI